MLADILKRYLVFYPEERQQLDLLLGQIEDNESLNDRRNFRGHITAGPLIISMDRKKILLIHHKAYDEWQQPGGHWEEGEASPFEAAKREGKEETGVQVKENIALDTENYLVPFDIDSHPVPARPNKDEPLHYHHDFRYVFLSGINKTSYQKEEVLAAEWVSLDNPKTGNIKRSIKKLKAAKIID